MANYTRNMRQTATYWEPGAPTASGGMSFSAPRQVLCRWQDKADLVRNNDGNETVSSAVVYPVEPLRRQGWLLLGVSSATDPRGIDGAHEIIAVGSSPSLDARLTLNKVWL